MVVASGTISFAKEMAIRKRINSMKFRKLGFIWDVYESETISLLLQQRFNKTVEDFPSLREYNDYLEEVEDMIWSLINGENVAALEMKIAEYEKQNYDQIMNSRARKAEELAAALAASKARPAQKDTEMAAIQNSETGVSTASQGQYAPAVAGSAFQPRPLGMGPQPLPIGGGTRIQLDDEEMMRRRAENGGRAGGWNPEFSRKRALEEAFGSLWI